MLLQRVFFFQAEDGIRDDLVTGVQTCALPIYRGDAVVPATSQAVVGREGPPRGGPERKASVVGGVDRSRSSFAVNLSRRWAMLARETSTDWSLKRRSDEVDEEFGEFEEDKELDEDFDDELDEDELDDEDLDEDDYDDLDDEFDEGDEDDFRPKKGPKREWE